MDVAQVKVEFPKHELLVTDIPEDRIITTDVLSATALNTMNARVRSLNARDHDGGIAIVTLSLEVKDTTELHTIMNRLGGISGVSEVLRSNN